MWIEESEGLGGYRDEEEHSPEDGDEPAAVNQAFIVPLFLREFGPGILQRERFSCQHREPDDAVQKAVGDDAHVVGEPHPPEAVKRQGAEKEKCYRGPLQDKALAQHLP